MEIINQVKDWMNGLATPFQFVILVIGFVLLIKGADWFVDGSSSIAAKFGIPQLVIGLTIVAMGTSAPEAAVSISAALKDSADITIGNIVGSNILNILVILGLSAVIIPLAVGKTTIRYEMPFMIIITGLLLLLGLDGKITLIDGLILSAAFIVYLTYLFFQAKKNKESQEDRKPVVIWKAALFLLLGLVMIILGSNLTVDSASRIAEEFGMSERLIGLTIVALGTSLPELCTSVVAARRGNADIAIGNIVGSNVFNVLFVVGLSSLVTTVPFQSKFIFDMCIAIGASVLLLLCCILGKGKLRRWGGALMLLSYAGYFAVII